jgi:hypothetical protein
LGEALWIHRTSLKLFFAEYVSIVGVCLAA